MMAVSRTRLEMLLGTGYESYRELQEELKELIRIRAITIPKLLDIADRLDKHHKNVNISKLVGSGVGIAGGVVGVVGLALIPVSLGISTVIAGVGGGVAALGGMAAAGADVAEFVITKRSGAQEVIDKDQRQCDKVAALWPKFQEVCAEVIKQIECERVPGEVYNPSTLRGKLWKQLKQKWASFKEWAWKLRISNPVMVTLFCWDVFSVVKAGFRACLGSWDVGVAIFRGLEECAKPGPILRLIISLVGRTTMLAFDAGFTAIGLILDIVTFIRTAIDMSKGSHSAAADKLRNVVQSLLDEYDSWNHLFLE